MVETGGVAAFAGGAKNRTVFYLMELRFLDVLHLPMVPLRASCICQRKWSQVTPPGFPRLEEAHRAHTVFQDWRQAYIFFEKSN
jgi:hypothetical protein